MTKQILFGKDFISWLKCAPKVPYYIDICLETTPKISKQVFSGTVIRMHIMKAWVNFHINPEVFTESTDKNYFRLPQWGDGEYPVFTHINKEKYPDAEYLGILPIDTLASKFFCNEVELNAEAVRRYLPKREEGIEGYPVYFNCLTKNIVWAKVR